jgi:hypothetical protein
MNVNSGTNKDLFRIQYLLVPGIYIVAVFFTTALSLNTPGGAYYRIWSLCPPVGILGMAMAIDDDVAIVAAFLLLGTPWWYLVGRIGWDAHKRRRSFLRPAVGAMVALFTCFVSTTMTLDPLK